MKFLRSIKGLLIYFKRVHSEKYLKQAVTQKDQN